MDYIPLNKLKQVKEIYFKRKESSNTVYIVNHYNHSDKTYSCSKVDDSSHEIFLKSKTNVFIGFTY
jgi:hypothetical protein